MRSKKEVFIVTEASNSSLMVTAQFETERVERYRGQDDVVVQQYVLPQSLLTWEQRERLQCSVELEDSVGILAVFAELPDNGSYGVLALGRALLAHDARLRGIA